MSHLPANEIQIARAELYDRASEAGCGDYHARHGISWETVAAFAGCLCVLPVEFFGRRFDFTDEGGELAAVIEAFEEDGETVTDLVAWPISNPRRVVSMFGRAPIVGHWNALNPATYVFDKPLRVHRTVLDWLKADCDGCAVVNPPLAARVFLDLPGRIAGEDQEHARHLARLLQSIIDLSRVVAPVGKAA